MRMPNGLATSAFLVSLLSPGAVGEPLSAAEVSSIDGRRRATHLSIRLMKFAFFVLILSPWCAGGALAMTEGKTAQSQPYVSGGVALGERESISKRRPEFSLWIVTAAKKTGSYLADARIKITDAAGKIVLDTKLDGPWLLVKLDSGRYKVDTSFGQQNQQKTITIRMDDHRETIFYFDVEVETLPPGVRG